MNLIPKLAFLMFRVALHLLLIAAGRKYDYGNVAITISSDDEEYTFDKEVIRDGPVRWYERLYADGAGLDTSDATTGGTRII